MTQSTGIRHHLAAAVTISFLLVSPFAAQVQKESSTPPPVFFETIDVRVINLEVVVTDGRGSRVEGLGPEDFRVKVDGVETPIDFFTEVAEGRAATSLPATRDGVASPDSAPVAEGQPVPTRILVFIDNLFSVEHHRNQVLEALEQTLDELGADDWMAIVAFDGLDLEILSRWENRTEILQRALEQARSAPAYGFHRIAEVKEIDNWRDLEREHFAIIESRMRGGSGSPFGAAEDDAESRGAADFERAFDNLENMKLHRAGGTEVDYAHVVRRQLRSTALAAASAMRDLAGGGGRKAMMLLAGGWPSSALEYAISDGTQSAALMLDASLTRAQMDADDPLVPMTDTANLLGYTLYPIDVPGFQRADTMSVGATNDSAFSIDQKEPTDLGVPQRTRELFQHDSLDFLAHETGGEALINARRMHALPAVYADTRDYYWLGFSRSRHDDDQHHAIEIEVLRPGLRARARTGFPDLSAETEADQQVEAALLFDSFSNTAPLELALGAPLEPWKKRLEVPLDVRIPLASVTMVGSGDAFVGEVEVRISVMDEDGNKASGEVRGLSIHGDGPPPPGAFYTYSTVLQIRNRDHKIVVGVQDIIGGNSLAGTTDLGSLHRR